MCVCERERESEGGVSLVVRAQPHPEMAGPLSSDLEHKKAVRARFWPCPACKTTCTPEVCSWFARQGRAGDQVGAGGVVQTSTGPNRDCILSYSPVMADQTDVRLREVAQVAIWVWCTYQLGAGRPALDTGVALVVVAQPHPRNLRRGRQCV